MKKLFVIVLFFGYYVVTGSAAYDWRIKFINDTGLPATVLSSSGYKDGNNVLPSVDSTTGGGLTVAGGTTTYLFSGVVSAAWYDLNLNINGVAWSRNSEFPLITFGVSGLLTDTITLSGNPPPPDTNYCTFTIRNNNTVFTAYQVIRASTGAPVYSSGSPAAVGLRPGQTGTINVATTNSCSTFGIMQLQGNVALVTDGSGGFAYAPASDGTTVASTLNPAGYSVGSSTSGYTTNSAPLYTSAGNTVYTNPASSGTNQVISFSTNAVAGDNINTLQTGFSALYSAIAQGNSVLDADLRTINGSVVGASNGIVSAINGLRFTNTFNADMTNYARAALGATNFDWSFTNLDSKFHDASGAQSYANGQISGVKSTLEGWESGAEGIPAVADGGTWVPMTITLPAGLPSYTIDPLGTIGTGFAKSTGVSFANLAATAKKIITWVLYIMYAVQVFKEIKEWFWQVVSMRGVGIPNLQMDLFGSGGNIAGAIIYPVVVAAVLALYATVLAAIATAAAAGSLNPSTIFSQLSSDPLSPGRTGPTGNGIALVGQFVPIPLTFGLALALLTFKITAMKIGTLACAAIKVLVHV